MGRHAGERSVYRYLQILAGTDPPITMVDGTNITQTCKKLLRRTVRDQAALDLDSWSGHGDERMAGN